MRAYSVLVLLLSLSACRLDGAEAPAAPPPTETASSPDSAASVYGDGRLPTDAEVEATRYDGRRRGVPVDTVALAQAAKANPEALDQIGAGADWAAPPFLPIGGAVAGPSVVKVQALLDRAGFSPGEIDGRWGDNAEMATLWFQKAASLPQTGLVDAATLRALRGRAGEPDSLVVQVRLTAEDVRGPFRKLPGDVYAKARLDRLGFESLAEALGERFHISPDVLRRMNPGVALDSTTAAGTALRVPNVATPPRAVDRIARLDVSGRDGYIHGVTSDGTVVFHAPITLGSGYDPSPQGDFRITSITPNPWWHYQPALLSGVPDDGEDANLPPGPNNAVGTVWMALSKPHYGIHGTTAPSTIGTATSSGCVRLTNWDVTRLSGLVQSGTPVQFRDITGRTPQGSRADSTSARPDAARPARRQNT